MRETLLEAIVCPKCHGELAYNLEKQQLICCKDRLIYPIKDGIPLLLIEEAIPLVDEAYQTTVNCHESPVMNDSLSHDSEE